MSVLPADLLAEAWAMEPRRLEQFARQISTLDLSAFFREPRQPESKSKLEVQNGVARIPVHGVLMKRVPGWMKFFGLSATGAEETRELVAEAVENESVESIQLDIDSPGGTVSGIQELADDVGAARGLKPVVASISDTAASAAYWIAAQADSINANSSAAVGSIGVYTAIADMSRMAENDGIKVHVVSSHPLKGAGVPGAPVTDAQLADIKRNIDGYAKLFVDAVARGRRMSREDAEKVATGQVWIGEEAKALGLVDEIRGTTMRKPEQPKSEAVVEAAEETNAPPSAEEKDMSAEKDAEIERLKAQIKADREARIEAIIGANRAKIAPAQVPAMRKLAAGCDDLAEFEAIVASFGAVTRDEPSTSVEPAAEAADEFSAADVAVAQKLETTPKRLATYSQVVGWFSDGRLKLEDGRVVTKAELEKGI